ncbi:MAG: hypothetical protein Ct9H300mP18_00280 [Candidatus Neomarinimicrobiota bacterium]|nr:MAG: hypothetical protein Ct9H300mP18_00280 [Candidatus Neomarinimicrobiota bacterium]
MANLATKFTQKDKKITIHTPLIDLKKSEIILKGNQLGIDYGITHSCYDPSNAGLVDYVMHVYCVRKDLKKQI